MDIIKDYSRQYRWRGWPAILAALPDVRGRLVLDLGCGVGDLAADLAARGAHVVGLDVNEECVAFASARNITNAEFRVADLREFSDSTLQVDGIWSSFTVAYFPMVRDTLETWLDHLRTGGWMALTEVNDLFEHKPLSARTRELLNGYVADSLALSRYDFRMGDKIPDILEQLGMEVLRDFTVLDKELSFAGRASPDVVEAWRKRFDRMYLLRDFCGPEFENVRDEFLNCLSLDDHECGATVRCVIATKRKL